MVIPNDIQVVEVVVAVNKESVDKFGLTETIFDYSLIRKEGSSWGIPLD